MNKFIGGFDPVEHSDAHGLECKDKSLAIQSQAEEADINQIVRNFGVTGQLPQGVRIPEYGDFDGVSDYRQAIEAVREAERSFYQMPAELRDKLGNDPQLFVEFCADPANAEELRKYGLVKEKDKPSASEAS